MVDALPVLGGLTAPSVVPPLQRDGARGVARSLARQISGTPGVAAVEISVVRGGRVRAYEASADGGPSLWADGVDFVELESQWSSLPLAEGGRWSAEQRAACYWERDAQGSVRWVVAFSFDDDADFDGPPFRRTIAAGSRLVSESLAPYLEHHALHQRWTAGREIRAAARRAHDSPDIVAVFAESATSLAAGFELQAAGIFLRPRVEPSLVHDGSLSLSSLLADSDIDLVEETTPLARMALARGRPVVLDLTATQLDDGLPLTEEIRAVGLAAGIRYGAWIPISCGERRFGALVLVRGAAAGRFDAATLEDLHEIASEWGVVMAARSVSRQARGLGRLLSSGEHQRVRFLNHLSHELKMPLAVIAANAEVAAVDALSDRGQASLRAIQAGVRRATWLADRVLAVARLDGDIADHEMAEVDLVVVARDAVNLMQARAEQSGRWIVTDLPIEPHEVMGSSQLLFQVVANLLDNAIKYGGTGNEVRLGIQGDGDTIRLVVEDDGIGIAEDEIDSVFDDFVRVGDDDGAAQRGSGLGLSIVRDIVERHAGTIAVESTLGQGSAFRVELPSL